MSGKRVENYPPPGLPFRLLSYGSEQVIFNEGWVVGFTGISSGQYSYRQIFTTVLGTGKQENLIAFMNKANGSFLMTIDPHGGIVRQGELEGYDYREPDERGRLVIFFSLELVGNGPNVFNLVSQKGDMTSFPNQRPSFEPSSHNPIGKELGMANPIVGVGREFILSFHLEDMAFLSLKYNVDEGTIFEPPAEVQMGSTQTIENDTDIEQSTQLTFKLETATTSTFTHTHGFEVKVGTEIKAGIPFIGAAKITVEGSTAHTWAWGSDFTEARHYETSVTAKAPPRSMIVGRAFISRSRIDVPYSIIIRSVSGRVEEHSHGIFRGVDYWDIRARYVQYPLPSSGHETGIEVLVPADDIKKTEMRRHVVIKTDQEHPPLYIETVELESEKSNQPPVDVETDGGLLPTTDFEARPTNE